MKEFWNCAECVSCLRFYRDPLKVLEQDNDVRRPLFKEDDFVSSVENGLERGETRSRKTSWETR